MNKLTGIFQPQNQWFKLPSPASLWSAQLHPDHKLRTSTKPPKPCLSAKPITHCNMTFGKLRTVFISVFFSTEISLQ